MGPARMCGHQRLGPPSIGESHQLEGNSEAKKKAKGRKPDAWRSRRGLTAGDPTSKALRPPGDAPSRPERWVATPRPRGGRAGVGTRGSRRGRRRAEWRERRRCGDGGRGVRPQHRPGKRGAPAPRGGPRRRAWQPRRPFGTSQLGEGREGHHDTCGRANRPHGDPSPVFVKCPGTIHTCVSRHQDARPRPATRPAGKKPSPQNRDLRAGGKFPLCDRGAR